VSKVGSRRADLYEGREARRYEQTRVVTDADIDELGHVNNVVYVYWVQKIAGEHWRQTADPALVERIAWVLTRHEIDYRRAAHTGDELTVRTWVGSATPVRYERFVDSLDASGRVLVSSRAVWSPIDRETGKLVRLDVSSHEPFYE
jgi:acyl-CoA thioester hydrolase